MVQSTPTFCDVEVRIDGGGVTDGDDEELEAGSLRVLLIPGLLGHDSGELPAGREASDRDPSGVDAQARRVLYDVPVRRTGVLHGHRKAVLWSGTIPDIDCDASTLLHDGP